MMIHAEPALVSDVLHHLGCHPKKQRQLRKWGMHDKRTVDFIYKFIDNRPFLHSGKTRAPPVGEDFVGDSLAMCHIGWRAHAGALRCYVGKKAILVVRMHILSRYEVRCGRGCGLRRGCRFRFTTVSCEIGKWNGIPLARPLLPRRPAGTNTPRAASPGGCGGALSIKQAA